MLPFRKYQGTGNDFVMIDQRETIYLKREDTAQIERLCDRKFGVGADGLILLQNHPEYDFEMIYFNADGKESSMCGNGGRCITAFAKALGIEREVYHFLAIDGAHDARILDTGWVELKMSDVPTVEVGEDYYVLNTGSPHYVVFVEDIDDINVLENGQYIRYSERFRKEGINVNFVEQQDDKILVATYERGVEDETLSCGTGVTAAAIATYLEEKKAGKTANMKHDIGAKGGALQVHFEINNVNTFENIWLCGPATEVFAGELPWGKSSAIAPTIARNKRTNISSGAKWEDIVGYSRAVKIGNVIEVAGTTAVDGDQKIGIGDAYLQTKFIFQKIEKALEAAGASMADVVRTRMFVTDISQWEAIGRAHGEFFKNIKPAASMIEVKGLIDPDLLIEIEVTAVLEN